MRRCKSVKHVLGIFAIVAWILFCLQGVIKALLEPTAPYTMTQSELDDAASTPADDTIPKIIHQVYLGWGGLPMPEVWNAPRQSCKDLNPDYEHKFWTNESSRNLLVEQYPWFLKTWDNYEFPIQRADSIRYFILASYGGIYIDLDNGCHRNLDSLRRFQAWMPGTTNHMGLTNHVMGATRNHSYFRMLIDSIEAYDHNWILPYLTIMNSAGPHFVSLVWSEYLKHSDHDEVRILSQEAYEGHSWSFFTKTPGGTWHHWDTLAFAWMGRHAILVAILVIGAIVGAVSAIWWLAWKLVLLAETSLKRNEGYSKLG